MTFDSGAFDRAVRDASTALTVVIEEACEAALVLGDRGVLIIRDPKTGTYTVGPSEEVPYGQIHSYPNGRNEPRVV